MTLDAVRRLFALQWRTNFPPGSGYLYCNTGFTLLSDVLEPATGSSFEAAMQDLVFGPLGMASTRVLRYDDGIVPGMARGYVGGDEDRRHGFYGFPVRGEGGVVSCLDDLLAFAEGRHRRSLSRQ